MPLNLHFFSYLPATFYLRLIVRSQIPITVPLHFQKTPANHNTPSSSTFLRLHPSTKADPNSNSIHDPLHVLGSDTYTLDLFGLGGHAYSSAFSSPSSALSAQTQLLYEFSFFPNAQNGGYLSLLGDRRLWQLKPPRSSVFACCSGVGCSMAIGSNVFHKPVHKITVISRSNREAGSHVLSLNQ